MDRHGDRSLPNITSPVYSQSPYSNRGTLNPTAGLGTPFLPSEDGYADGVVYPDPEQVGIGLNIFPRSESTQGDEAVGVNDQAPDPSAADSTFGDTTRDPTVNPPPATADDAASTLFEGEDENYDGSEFIMYPMDEEAQQSGNPAQDDAPLSGQGEGVVEETLEGESFWDEMFETTLDALVPRWARDDEDEEMEG